MDKMKCIINSTQDDIYSLMDTIAQLITDFAKYFAQRHSILFVAHWYDAAWGRIAQPNPVLHVHQIPHHWQVGGLNI